LIPSPLSPPLKGGAIITPLPWWERAGVRGDVVLLMLFLVITKYLKSCLSFRIIEYFHYTPPAPRNRGELPLYPLEKVGDYLFVPS